MPKINPEVLVWARDTAGLSPAQAAQKLGIRATKVGTGQERVEALEAGTTSPSVALLRKMAKVYRRPLVTFFLSAPPARGERGEDFRSLPDAADKDNPLVETLLRDIKARQDMVRALLEDDTDAVELPFVGAHSPSEGVAAIAASLTSTIKFELQKFRAASTAEAAFAYLRRLTESEGVFVLLAGNLGSHHTTIDVEAFRGFALADKVAPFVVVNDQDAKSAWSFTLLHELAHIWLGRSGVSGARLENAIEKFCSDVASSILLPDLANFTFVGVADGPARAEAVNAFARERRISASMVAYRLYLSDRLDEAEWQRMHSYFRKKWLDSRAAVREKARESDNGPNYYIVRRHRVGTALIDLVSRWISDGTITPTKAGKVLGVKARSVAPLLRLGSTPLALGGA